MLGQFHGHALINRARSRSAQRANALQQRNLGRRASLDLDVFAVRVTPIHQKQAHAQEVKVSYQPEQEHEQSNGRRPRQKPDDACYADDGKQCQHDEGSHATVIRHSACGGPRLVRDLEGGKRDAQRFLDDGQQQVRHDRRFVNAAPSGGYPPLAHHTQTHELGDEHGQPIHHQVHPAAFEYRDGEYREEQRRKQIDEILDG